MDKRWILILIILLAGAVCAYHVVDSSTSVGNAITVLNKSVITLPDDFTIGESEKNSAELLNTHNNEKILITDFGKNDDSQRMFNENLTRFNDAINIIVNKNSTMNINDVTTYRIDLFNSTTGEDVTLAYIYSSGHTFTIRMTGYDNETKLDNDLNFIVSTITPDFKQSQD